MCHVLLVMPILGLAVFWLWPIPIAIPVYLVIVLLSAFLYYFVIQAMRRPVETGAEGIRQKTGRVVEARNRRLRIRVGSELWYAVSTEKALRKGDRVEIVGIDGLTLRVQRLESQK